MFTFCFFNKSVLPSGCWYRCFLDRRGMTQYILVSLLNPISSFMTATTNYTAFIIEHSSNGMQPSFLQFPWREMPPGTVSVQVKCHGQTNHSEKDSESKRCVNKRSLYTRQCSRKKQSNTGLSKQAIPLSLVIIKSHPASTSANH